MISVVFLNVGMSGFNFRNLCVAELSLSLEKKSLKFQLSSHYVKFKPFCLRKIRYFYAVEHIFKIASDIVFLLL